MKKKDLRRGAIYAVKVSGTVQACRLITGYADDGTPAGSSPWTVHNIKTGRRITVRGAARFRYELEPTTADELRAQPGREWKPKVAPIHAG